MRSNWVGQLRLSLASLASTGELCYIVGGVSAIIIGAASAVLLFISGIVTPPLQALRADVATYGLVIITTEAAFAALCHLSLGQLRGAGDSSFFVEGLEFNALSLIDMALTLALLSGQAVSTQALAVVLSTTSAAWAYVLASLVSRLRRNI